MHRLHSVAARAFLFNAASCALIAIILNLVASAQAQTVTWGLNGAGGNGTWDTTTADWFDGTNNVSWPTNGDAIFGGTGGTVNLTTTQPIVSSMTFNSPGYTIQNGTLLSGPTGLTVTTNAAATISSEIDHSVSSGNSLTKNGSAPLTLGGFLDLATVQVNEGELRGVGDIGLSFANVTLANAPGVMVTLSPSFSGTSDMQSLSGGGALGGIVQPLNTSGTVTLELGGKNGSFAGVIQDNQSAVLSLNMDGLTGAVQTLTNANIYLGTTSITGGTLSLAGTGSILNSIVSTTTNGSLLLDNSSTAVANRISDTSPFTMNGGSIQLVGNSSTPVNELVGALNISGPNSISVTQPGSAAAQLSFAGLTRNGYATVSVVGPGVSFSGLANGSTGIVAPYVTAGNEWASIGNDGRITPYTAYASNINTGAATDNVKLSGAGTTSLAASSVRSSLNLQNSGASGQVLNLAGQNLTLTTGGILSSGSGTTSIAGGNLASTSPEMIVTVNNNLTIGANIGDGPDGTTLTKTGPGTLTLAGTNSYTGTTEITQGTLVVSSDANLGQGSTIDIGNATLQAAASFSSTKGITSSAEPIGRLDTAGFNVTFSGPLTGTINKFGAGTLTLSNPNVGTTDVIGGTLVLPNPITGNVNLGQGTTVQVAGTLGSLGWSTGGTLDIGGPAAATLTTANAIGFSASLLVDFGIGSTTSDLWNFSGFTSPFNFASPGSVQFDFQNLGGLATGVDYPIITFANTPFPPNANIFAFAPDMAAKGFYGTFHITGHAVMVNFSSVPEPGLTALLLLQGTVAAVFLGRRRSAR
ncbi:MAG TPA: autotransporter-associated beta strand repeat-containing protein [Pirellulales bacterium]